MFQEAKGSRDHIGSEINTRLRSGGLGPGRIPACINSASIHQLELTLTTTSLIAHSPGEGFAITIGIGPVITGGINQAIAFVGVESNRTEDGILSVSIPGLPFTGGLGIGGRRRIRVATHRLLPGAGGPLAHHAQHVVDGADGNPDRLVIPAAHLGRDHLGAGPIAIGHQPPGGAHQGPARTIAKGGLGAGTGEQLQLARGLGLDRLDLQGPGAGFSAGEGLGQELIGASIAAEGVSGGATAEGEGEGIPAGHPETPGAGGGNFDQAGHPHRHLAAALVLVAQGEGQGAIGLPQQPGIRRRGGLESARLARTGHHIEHRQFGTGADELLGGIAQQGGPVRQGGQGAGGEACEALDREAIAGITGHGGRGRAGRPGRGEIAVRTGGVTEVVPGGHHLGGELIAAHPQLDFHHAGVVVVWQGRNPVGGTAGFAHQPRCRQRNPSAAHVAAAEGGAGEFRGSGTGGRHIEGLAGGGGEEARDGGNRHQVGLHHLHQEPGRRRRGQLGHRQTTGGKVAEGFEAAVETALAAGNGLQHRGRTANTANLHKVEIPIAGSERKAAEAGDIQELLHHPIAGQGEHETAGGRGAEAVGAGAGNRNAPLQAMESAGSRRAALQAWIGQHLLNLLELGDQRQRAADHRPQQHVIDGIGLIVHRRCERGAKAKGHQIAKISRQREHDPKELIAEISARSIAEIIEIGGGADLPAHRLAIDRGGTTLGTGECG